VIFPNWKQRAVDKAQRHQSGQSTMRISRVTLALLKKLRGNVEASDDETVYYAAAQAIRDSAGALGPADPKNNDTERIQRAPQRPVNAADADLPRLPSERSGS
jgi:hypothetical protein